MKKSFKSRNDSTPRLNRAKVVMTVLLGLIGIVLPFVAKATSFNNEEIGFMDASSFVNNTKTLVFVLRNFLKTLRSSNDSNFT